jgi:ribosome-interacting GTPase 1
MPTNLPPEAVEAEQRYREATTLEEKVNRLQELISAIPKHKGTDKLRADYRRRLSKLKDSAAQQRKQGRRDVSPYHIDREGAGQIVLIGRTNSGKSSIVATLTNATPEVSAAPFTTWQPTPGMMPVDNVQIQLIDTPPLTPDYVEPELMNLIRRVDMVLLVVDLQTDPLQQIESALAILEEHNIAPEHRRDQYPTPHRIWFVPMLLLVNKHDDETTDEVFQIFLELLDEEWPLLPISTVTGRNLEYLKQTLFDRLQIIRVYSKAPGQEPDFGSPFIMKKGGTVRDFAGKIHQDFRENLKAARVWGEGVYDGQMVSRDHVLHDGDVVELRV